MHIKTIILEGFKSYCQRTEISGFDPQFNAITGLNGSGKSNILDSICFLLGITNLSHVRAASLQDLVYKSGQAGIKKATVSITFDNKDKKSSPLGYESYPELTITRQIVIGGKNKYLINGITAKNETVHKLFHSIKLNVNNPHFLIMQGRITKVLNMKPPEILSLLEEAAGTKLYENRKQETMKTIQKKDLKLREIDSVIKQELTPTIDRLREERASYRRYETVTRELEYLTKFLVAYDYIRIKETISQKSDSVQSMVQELNGYKTKLEDLESKKKDVGVEIEELETEKNLKEDQELQELETRNSENQKNEAVAKNRCKRADDNLKTIIKEVKEQTRQLENSKKALAEKVQELNSISGAEYQDMLSKAEKAQNDFEEAEKNLQAVNAGMLRAADGHAASLNEQLRLAEGDRSTADTHYRQLGMKIEHLTKEVKTKRQDCEKSGAFNKGQSDDEVRHDKLKLEVNKLNELIDKIRTKQQQFGENMTCRRKIEMLHQEINSSNRDLMNLQFEYRDPRPGFDRRKVYGPVAKLVQVKDMQFAQALQTAAGAKLYNIVVDSDDTSTLLLNHGALERRVTMLPLNRIRGNPVPQNVLAKAQQLVGRDKVFSALDLIEFDRVLTPAMEFAFGGCLVCTDLDTAKRVAFAPGIEKRTVTLEGDVFDPAGTLSGGSRAQNAVPLLVKVAKLHQLETELQGLRKEHATYENRMTETMKLEKELRIENGKLQEAKHNLNELEFRLRETDKHRLRIDLEAMEAELQQLKGQLTQAKEKCKEAEEKVEQVRHRVNNAAEEQDKERKLAQRQLEQARKAMQETQLQLQNKDFARDRLNIDIQAIENEVTTISNALKQMTDAEDAAEKSIADERKELEKVLALLKESSKELEQHHAFLKELTKKIQLKRNEMESLKSKISATGTAIEKLSHEIDVAARAREDNEALLRKQLKSNPWIIEEEQEFGQPDGPYCFEKNNPSEIRTRHLVLSEEKQKLNKLVNVRAINSLTIAEDQYNDLLNKRKIVMKNKNDLQAYIDELDSKRLEILEKAYSRVNEEFDLMFNTLLPNSSARLRPPEGKSMHDGLEFKVALGGVPKDSLNELSGGQRSLVALSLILALLQFQPAPLYILDEVDAALDLSHTQNIGMLIKNHFKKSQFIVVSLKDGMFNNANVLFKTKFVDGVSTVNRHAAIKC
ncbi:Structural maintenance of chromosomes protein 2 [Cichlidogyrus casuarinus]|uniref:Structural maintenance of chromosomes protein n=1 Tax=Cichlidogyrus casuarinus TaxID=1844966 RepID=A0ABD2QFQ3_9PLAT